MLSHHSSPVDAPPNAPGASANGAIAIEDLAALLKACGDGLRLQILQLLRQDSLAVQELCATLGIRQPALSHHLKVMAGAGLVTRRREGNTIFYRRAVPDTGTPLGRHLVSLLTAVDAIPLTAALARELQSLHRDRAQSSRQFFRENADKFRAQQDLIASYDQYADTVAETLASVMPGNYPVALEVGPGDGAFLSFLSPRFEQVVALDNAEEMLDQSRERAAADRLDNIEFVHGDTRHPRLASLQANCIVANMVLHHTPSPAEIFDDLAKPLVDDGVLLVTELCHHDQGWAREACGDLWLGFEPKELSAWAARAGLVDIASAYLAQRNGFQVQVRLFGRQTNNQGQTP